MLTIDGPAVLQALPMDRCIAAVEEAFRAHAEGKVHSAVLSVHGEAGAFHTKVALTPAYFGAKTNANFPSNPSKRGLPSIQGAMLLFDASDGRIVAVIDSIELTALRTAAATAVAAKYLARADSRTVMIIGCGKQASAQLAALRQVLP